MKFPAPYPVSRELRVPLTSLQELASRIAPETRVSINSTGAVMKSSNLAERLEEFEAAMAAVDAAKEKTTPVVAVADCGIRMHAPRRASFASRRIQIRDPGLRHFRVF
jgi:hypothetical protein